MKLYIESLLKAYSGILFLPKVPLGIIILAVSLLQWKIATGGLLALAGAFLAARLLKREQLFVQQGAYIFNPLLVGFSIGYLFPFSSKYLVLAPVMGVLTLLTTIAASHLFALYFKLPVLSLPFVIVSTLIYLSASKYIQLPLVGLKTTGGFSFPLELPLWISGYFKSLGAIFFMPQVYVGLAVAVGILAASRVLFFLSMLGYYSGVAFSALLTGGFVTAFSNVEHFNSILVAMAIGGVFLIPSLKNYLMAIMAVCVSVVCMHGVSAFWAYGQIPGFTLAFNVVTLVFIYVSGISEYEGVAPMTRETPEELLEYHLLNRQAGQGAFRSIMLPFSGKWTVWQANDGRWTHRGHWRYAYDFIITDTNGKSYRGGGKELEDYYAFGKPVLAPVRGRVVKVVNSLPDNPVGSIDSTNNWGNLVILESQLGFFVGISHFSKGSISVEEGAWVEPGTLLGLCGNSGYSAQPHIHIQAQLTPLIGGYTVPFRFSAYANFSSYHCGELPPEQRVVEPLYPDKSIDIKTSTVAGDVLEYQVLKNDTPMETLKLTVRMAEDGTFYYDSGKAKLYFGKRDGAFCFYWLEGRDASLALMLMALPRFPLVFREGLKWCDVLPAGVSAVGWRRVLIRFAATFYHRLGRMEVSLVSSKKKVIEGVIRSRFPATERKTSAVWDDEVGFVSFKVGDMELRRQPEIKA
ncbi:MAG: peptidoglycan DD-metalloendopeptidase family protein [bacterium]|nr:peptidoglycan DD-metalloendopeptidase family protein [bacterium]